MIINTYLDNTAINYGLFIEVINRLSSKFTNLIMVFHGYQPSILKNRNIINIFNKFQRAIPLFLFPTISSKNFGGHILSLLPISNFVTHSINYN